MYQKTQQTIHKCLNANQIAIIVTITGYMENYILILSSEKLHIFNQPKLYQIDHLLPIKCYRLK